jgi:hypothetical protein
VQGCVAAWNDWAPPKEQSHIAGLALFGRLKAGERQAIKYNAALLLGLNSTSSKHTLRVLADYVFRGRDRNSTHPHCEA